VKPSLVGLGPPRRVQPRLKLGHPRFCGPSCAPLEEGKYYLLPPYRSFVNGLSRVLDRLFLLPASPGLRNSFPEADSPLSLLQHMSYELNLFFASPPKNRWYIFLESNADRTRMMFHGHLPPLPMFFSRTIVKPFCSHRDPYLLPSGELRCKWFFSFSCCRRLKVSSGGRCLVPAQSRDRPQATPSGPFWP